MFITSNFDSGNIEVVDSANPSQARLRICKDHKSDFYQWFHFRASGLSEKTARFVIENAGGAAYADGWDGYSVCASYDRETWFRIPTRYADGTLSWSFQPEKSSVYFAYFAPYSMERHADLIASVAASPIARTTVLGHTLDGRDMDLVEIGEATDSKKKIWLIARQHPGETMAEWWMEGALDFLLDEDNPVARKLLENASFHIVPNMNPDGSARGHLRTNAAGYNLNREWKDASLENSPEVYFVREKMADVGVDFHMDVHGDEALPYNFIAGFESIPSVTDRMLGLLDQYQTLLCAQSPDFQRTHGYPKGKPGSSDLRKCTDYTAETHGCIAMTLEMPFKDNADLPDEAFGWNPERCRYLAHACLTALAQMVDEL